MSEEHWTCPNCNSDTATATNKHLEGELVIHCRDCDSWFGAETNRPVLFVEDGGDDQPDKRNIADHAAQVILAALILMVEEGYLTEDGDITPLGEDYISAVEQEGMTKTFDLPITRAMQPPPSIDAPNFGAQGDHDWTDLN